MLEIAPGLIQGNSLRKFYKYRKEIKLPPRMTIGIEIESNGWASDLVPSLVNKICPDWEVEVDPTIQDEREFLDGVEVKSPKLTGNMQECTKSIYLVCELLNTMQQNATHVCGGHIHIGADYLSTYMSFDILKDLCIGAEEILYIISNPPGIIPRENIIDYARPLPSRLLSVQLDSELAVKSFIRDVQQNKYSDIDEDESDRFYGFNFSNIGKEKNTIEFRFPNGTINPNTWVENINLFGGIVRAAETLFLISSKPPTNRTPLEQGLLENFSQIRNSETDEEVKLASLLAIAIPPGDRRIYLDRYSTNIQLITNSTEGVSLQELRGAIHGDDDCR